MKTRTGRVRRTVAVVTVAGALSVGVSALSAGAAAADSSPEIQYPDAATCLFLFNTDGYAGTPAGALRQPAQQPDTILICRINAQQHL